MLTLVGTFAPYELLINHLLDPYALALKLTVAT